MEIAEQVVVVTGAGRGIGAATARAFAAVGAAVAVSDIHAASGEAVAAGIGAAGGRAFAFPADVADRAAMADLFTAVRERFGPATTLVNNAAYVPFLRLAEYTPEVWEKALNIDLSGVFYAVQAAVPQMNERGAGFIVNIGSVHAHRTLPGTAAYAAAKAGLLGLTRNLALELGPRNIRVNTVSPGAVEADALRAYFESLPEERREAERQHMLSWQPLGRFGRPEDIAQVVVFLCSPAAAYIHGTEIVADGGSTARLF